MTKSPIAWETVEHVYYQKTADWYWWVGIVGLTTAVLAFLWGNTLFAGVMVIGTLSIMIHGARRPRAIKVELTGNGVRVGSRFHPYTKMKAFSLDEEASPPVLVLDTKSILILDVRLFIEGPSVESVRDYLLDHLNEKYHEPSFTEGLIHYLGF